jgi:hypothetical protein
MKKANGELTKKDRHLREHMRSRDYLKQAEDMPAWCRKGGA